MSPITYRLAYLSDYQAIADLHALSWQANYRGILTDEFLDHEVFANRRTDWQKRLNSESNNQFSYIAQQDGKLIGFVGAFGNYDPVHGTLLDNLHVAQGYQGKGIGKALMCYLAEWVQSTYPSGGIYLWVFEENKRAMEIYTHLGGIKGEQGIETNFGTRPVPERRFSWPDPADLCSK